MIDKCMNTQIREDGIWVFYLFNNDCLFAKWFKYNRITIKVYLYATDEIKNYRVGILSSLDFYSTPLYQLQEPEHLPSFVSVQCIWLMVFSGKK